MNQNDRRRYLIEGLLKERPEYENMQIPSDAGEQKMLLRSLMNIRMPGEMDDAFLHVQDAYLIEENRKKGIVTLNCSPSSRQLKKFKFFLPAEIFLLAVFMQLASKFRVFPLVLKFQDSFASVYCCSNLYNLRSFLREYLYQ